MILLFVHGWLLKDVSLYLKIVTGCVSVCERDRLCVMSASHYMSVAGALICQMSRLNIVSSVDITICHPSSNSYMSFYYFALST